MPTGVSMRSNRTTPTGVKPLSNSARLSNSLRPSKDQTKSAVGSKPDTTPRISKVHSALSNSATILEFSKNSALEQPRMRI